MILRVCLSATLILNPIADAFAQSKAAAPYATAFTAKNGASTRLSQTDAQDWIIEGVANRDLGNKDRARELFEAARARLEVDKIPEPYAAEIHERLNAMVVSVGGTATKHQIREEVKPPQRLETENCPTAGMGTLNPENNDNDEEDPRTRTPRENNTPAANGNSNCDVRNLAEGLTLDDLEVIPADFARPKGQLLIASDRLSLADLTRATQNDEVRALLWWLTAGRIAFYAKDENLAQIIQRKVNPQDRQQIDSFRTGFGMGGYGYGNDYNPGFIQEMLISLGLFKNYASEAHALIQMFDGSKLDEMADRHVRDAMKYGGMLGGLFKIWGGAKYAGPTAGTGQSSGLGSRFGGGGLTTGTPSRAKIYADSSLTFINNASYMFKMAALYGVQLDQHQMQTIGLMMLAIVKGGLNLRKASPRMLNSTADINAAVGPLGRVMRVLGRNFHRSVRAGNADEFIETAANKVMGIADDALVGGIPAAIGSASTGGGMGVTNNNPAAANNGGTVNNGSPFDNGSTTTPDPNKPAQPKKKRIFKKLSASERALVLGGFLARGLKGTAYGVFEAGAVAKLSKYFFSGFYEDTIKLQNKSFIRILNSKKGFAFLKLLIHAMQLEEDSITKLNLTNKTREMQFILNLARTAGICSPSDYDKLEGAKNLKASQVPHEVRVLRFSCPSKRETYYYDLLVREMMTFNAVKTKNLVRLRASILRDRLKMAQLLIQFQFIDGRQTQEEQEFFEDVTSKILGITSSEQRHYLDIFEGFIKQSDLITSKYSPTGFAFTDRAGRDPYDNTQSPTPVNSPSQVLAVDWGDPGPSEDPSPWGSTGRFNTNW